jgi:tetratricopeptide (TPR) repeat protein
MADSPSAEEFRDKAIACDVESLDQLLTELADADLPAPAAQEIEGLVRGRLGEKREALALLVTASAAPKHTCHIRSLITLLRLQVAAGDTEGALQAARRAIDVDPTNQEALKTAGRLCNQRQDWDRADRFWRQLCDVAPTDADAALQVARIAGRRGQWETQAFFADILMRDAPDHEEALSLALESRRRLRTTEGFEKLIPAVHRSDPERAHALLRSMNRPDEAERVSMIIAALRAAAPGDAVLAGLGEHQAKTWVELGLREEMERKDASAARLYRAARTAHPSLEAAEQGLQRLRRESLTSMRAALKAADSDATVQYAEAAIAIDPNIVEAWYSKGRAILSGDPGGAARCLERCVELTPDDPWMQLNLGRALERGGDLEPALIAYREVIRLTPDPENSRRSEAAQSLINVRQKLIRAGRDAFQDNRLEEAWQLYSAAATAPDPPEAVATMMAAIKRGLFISVREKFKNEDPGLVEAAEDYLRKDPDNVETLVYLGRRLMPLRQHDRALAVWRRLAELRDDDAHYQLQIARCCSWLRRKEEGAAAASAALRLSPDLPEAATLLEQFAPA